MKLMTLNAHGLPDEGCEDRLRRFVRGVVEEMPDVIALQEVCQSMDAPPADAALLKGYVPVQQDVSLRADSFAARAAALLREAGVMCSWTCLPFKAGYGRYDEGLALMSLGRRILRTEKACISRTQAYSDWRRRCALAAKVEGLADWFVCVHTGWWEDGNESFPAQWRALEGFCSGMRKRGQVWLMGDFNAPDNECGRSYDHIAAAGWHDAFPEAETRQGWATVTGAIDGWKGERAAQAAAGMRIDQIWHARPCEILSASVVFDGVRHERVSDHAGVMVCTQQAAGNEGREEFSDEEL